MKQSSSASSAVPFIDVNTGRFNDMVASIEDAADLTTSLDQLRQSVDQYYTLRTLSCLYSSNNQNSVAYRAVEALVPSTEATIFTIGAAVAKAIFNVCKFVINTIGKVWKFFFSFFKRNAKNIAKDIDLIYDKVQYMGDESVSPSVTNMEVALWQKIVDEHCNHLEVSHNIQPGTKINAYKTQFYAAFNATVASEARVTDSGAVEHRPHRNSGSSKVRMLGWTSGDALRGALTDITEAENSLSKAIKTIKERGKDVAKVANLCNNYIKSNSSNLSNEFLAEKGSHCIDAACIVTIISKDTINLKYLENEFGKMVAVMRNRAKQVTA